MTFEQAQEAIRLRKRGHTPMSIARCLSDVSTADVIDFFGEPWPKHPDHCGFSPNFYRWLMDDCEYTWRPNNPNPKDAPWSRIVR
tara:strand:+ start:219 stop:473 length:255 start_codon:yes stop_codon:yes gene_type:complete